MPEQTQPQLWAVIDLMGHVTTAGRIEMGTLLRVDVPDGDAYRTEFYGMGAIYSIRIVSEEIARAFATRQPDVVAYDAPVVLRSQHEAKVKELQEESWTLAHKLRELQKLLPEPTADEA